ncbi:MAG: PD40 domain-containing protein, partial [Acidobacteria bacterium]|nr:PD40 domain-containing protein [Acidobacteriota bacterium]
MNRLVRSAVLRLLLLAAALLCGGHLTQAVAQVSCLNPTQLTRSTGVDIAPAWDPASETIAYMTVAGSVQNIGRVRADGTGEGPMATGPNSPFGIGFSLSWVGSTGLLMTNEQVSLHEYMTFNSALTPFTRTVSNGSDAAFTQKLVIPGGGGGGLIRVSRNGATVLWQHNDSANSGPNQIRVAPFSALTGQNTNAVGTRLVPLDRTGFYFLGAALTPNGSQFVISKPSGTGNDLFLHNSSDGSLVRQLTTSGASSGADNRGPDISPDGTKVAFGSNYNGAGGTRTVFNLFLINLDGTALTNVTNSPTLSALEPSFAPDGQRLAFRAVDTTASAPNNDIYVCRLTAPGPVLSISPPSLEFFGVGGGGEQTMSVGLSTASSSSFTASDTVDDASFFGEWLSVSPASGTTASTGITTLSVTVNFRNLHALTFVGNTLVPVAVVAEGDILVTAGTTTVKVHVKAAARLSPAQLVVTPQAVVFTAAENGAAPRSQEVQIFNRGSASLQWSMTLSDPAPWLSLTQTSGTLAGLGYTTTTLTVNPAGRAPGLYQTRLTVTAPDAADSPQEVAVTLHVAPASAPPRLDLTPTGMVFVTQVGGSLPAPQALAVSNAGGGSFSFALTLSGAPWASLSQTTGTIVSDPVQVQVSVNTLAPSLAAAILRGKILVLPSNGPVQEVELVLVVAPSSSTLLQRELPSAAACTPQSMDLAATTIGNGTNLPVSFPRSLLALAVDNCGGSVSNATVVANVEGLAITMQGVGNGQYSGTWTPVKESASVAMSVVATHPTLGTVQRAYTISTSAAAGGVALPVLSENGVLEAAGLTPLRPLAPGSIVSIFGSQFAMGNNFATTVPLGQSLGGTSVRIGNENAPLYYVGPEQINAQVPFTAKVGESVSVVVIANGKLTAPQN